MKNGNAADRDAVSGASKLIAPAAAIEDSDGCALAVQAVEDLIGGYSRDFIRRILLTVTVNAIHVEEYRAQRKRIEQEYIKALQFLSAVEEQFQPEDPTDPPDYVDECSANMMRHIFRAIRGG